MVARANLAELVGGSLDRNVRIVILAMTRLSARGNRAITDVALHVVFHQVFACSGFFVDRALGILAHPAVLEGRFIDALGAIRPDGRRTKVATKNYSQFSCSVRSL